MTPSQLATTCRWLVRDTFRQSLHGRLFWLMLSISAVCVLFCLGVGIQGGEPLLAPDDIEVGRPHGQLTLAFGAFRGPLFRDGEAAVRFLQLVLGEWVAGAGGVLLALVFTAGFLPAFLEPHASAVLLAKPVPRWVLLFGKYLGVLAFVGFQATVFVGGTWLALGLRTGYFPADYLWCIPLLLLHFAVVYSASVLLAVCTRSTTACVFGSILFWLVCWGMNYGRHALVTLPALDSGATPLPTALTGMAEAAYWLLPKPADLGIVLERALDAGNQLGTVPAFEAVEKMGAFYPELSVLTSLLFAAGMLVVAARHLATLDY
jgi:hypothetical protein